MNFQDKEASEESEATKFLGFNKNWDNTSVWDDNTSAYMMMEQK